MANGLRRSWTSRSWFQRRSESRSSRKVAKDSKGASGMVGLELAFRGVGLKLGRVLKVAKYFSIGLEMCSILGMKRRFELSDEVWDQIAPQLPAERGRKARPCRNNRRMVNAMLWILRTGAPWRDLRSHYPPWKSVYTRFSRWSSQGIWQQVLGKLTQQADMEGFLIDGTVVRAHQDAYGARKGGRSRSGVHAEARPVRFMLS
jgi:transposase